jgi:hypothetical protein
VLWFCDFGKWSSVWYKAESKSAVFFNIFLEDHKKKNHSSNSSNGSFKKKCLTNDLTKRILKIVMKMSYKCRTNVVQMS